jgi:hypothetical protein
LGVVGRRQDFARRLTMIMRECVPYRVSACGLLAVGVLALAALPNWSLGQREAPPPTAPKQAAPAAQPAPNGPLSIALDYGFPVVKQAAEEPQDPAKPDNQEKRTTAPAQPAGTPATLAQVAQPATFAVLSDRDRRLKELEDKLEALLREIKDLRGGSPAAAATAAPATAAPAASHKTGTTSSVTTAPATSFVPAATPQGVQLWSVTSTGKGADPNAAVTLSRTSYKLPKEKAEALSAFLREHVKAQVLETKVEGDNFIVTTTPEAQHVISQFVALIEGKPLAPAHGTSIYGAPAPAK